MKANEYLDLIRSDMHRYSGNSSFRSYIYDYFFIPGFKYCFWMRTCLFLHSRMISKILLFPIARLILNHYQYKFGISISYQTKIDKGLYIGHFGGIVVNPLAVIGKNCNISHEVTIGSSNRGQKRGVPVIGDNVYIGPGAKIFGNIRIGNNVAVGANCVVSKDVPDNGIIVGIPGEVISWDGSAGYVNNTDYQGTTVIEENKNE